MEEMGYGVHDEGLLEGGDDDDEAEGDEDIHGYATLVSYEPGSSLIFLVKEHFHEEIKLI